MKDLEQILNEKLNDHFMEEHISPVKAYIKYKKGKLHVYVKTPKDYKPCLIVEPNAQYSLGMTFDVTNVNITDQQYINLYPELVVNREKE
jgi:hypothetical protein